MLLTAGELRIDNGKLTIKNSMFSANESRVSNGGGAIYLNAGNFKIDSTSFTQNTATYQGGACLIDSASFGEILDSNFTGNRNTVSNGGGALFIKNCSPKLSGCRFLRNSTDANNHGG